MTYAFTYDIPADEQMYRQVKAAIGDERPKGLIVHLVVRADTAFATSTCGRASKTGSASKTRASLRRFAPR